ncbi:hypothetical protein D3C72_2158890 [compost metagenome]
MIVMAVGEEQIVVVDAFGDQRGAGFAQSGSCIEEQHFLAASNFDAGCISPIAQELLAGDRQTPSYAPEPHSKVVFLHSCFGFTLPAQAWLPAPDQQTSTYDHPPAMAWVIV